MIIGNDRNRTAAAPSSGGSTALLRRVRRLSVLAAVGAAAAVVALSGCGNGVQVSGPSGGSGTAVSTPVADPGDGSAAPTPDGGGSGSADPEQTADHSDDQTDDSTATASDAPDSASGRPTAETGGSAGGATGTDPATGSTDQRTDASAESRTSRPTCRLADLRVGVRTPQGGAGAGSRYVLLDFTNTSGASCWMYGYAGVSFVGHHNGSQLGSPATRDRSTGPTRIRLDVGEKTSELLQIANAGNFPAKQCAPTRADGFRIYPPASTTAAYLPYRTDACQSRKVSQLTIHPVGTRR